MIQTLKFLLYIHVTYVDLSLDYSKITLGRKLEFIISRSLLLFKPALCKWVSHTNCSEGIAYFYLAWTRNTPTLASICWKLDSSLY